MKIEIPKDVYDSMIEHCVRGLPNEACGFLAGSDAAVSSFYPLTNAAASPVYYRPDDREMIAALNDIDDKEMDLLAIFHSHVNSPPRPSPTDVREAHYPEAVYLIVSLTNTSSPESQGWMIKKKQWSDEAGEVVTVDLVIS